MRCSILLVYVMYAQSAHNRLGPSVNLDLLYFVSVIKKSDLGGSLLRPGPCTYLQL